MFNNIFSYNANIYNFPDLYVCWFVGYVTILKPFFQYSLLYRKDNAHEDSIWSCAWGRMKKKDNENGDGDGSRYVLSFSHNLASQVGRSD